MHRRIWLVWILLVGLFVPWAGHAAENLLQDDAWTADMWNWAEGISALDVGSEEEDGPARLHIVSQEENDARFLQTVAVTPGTVYVVRGQVMASGISGGEKGANLSIGGTYVYSDAVWDTDGEWVDLELYGITGDDQTELTLMARIGGYNNTASGEAWFRDISMEETDEIPEGTEVFSFALPQYAAQGEEDIALEPDTLSRDTARLLLGAILSALISAALLLYSSRHGDKAERRRRIVRLSGVVLTALAVRVALAVLVRGYDTDMRCFLAWSERVFRTGLGGFYADGYFCDYPPGYMYVLWIVGALRNLMGLQGDTRGAWLLVKLPNILADITACVLLWNIVEERWGTRDAFCVTLLYAFGPAVLMDSAVWGQTDGFLALLLLAVFLLASQRRWLPAMLVYAVAILVKPQALLVAPLGLFALVWDTAHTEPDKRGAAVRRAILGAGGAIVLLLLLAYPFARTQVSQRWSSAPSALQPVLWLIEKYMGTLGSYSYYSVNACNFWDLLNRGWQAIAPGPAQTFGWAAYVLAFAASCWLYAKAREPRRLFLIGGTLLSFLFFFGLKMHERYLFPALLLLLAAYVQDRDVRISLAAILLGFAQLLNLGLVLLYDYTLFAPRWLALLSCVSAMGGCGLLGWASVDICLRGKEVTITRIYTPSTQRLRRQEEQAGKAMRSALFRQRDSRIGLSRREALTVLAVTALYAVFAFCNLGTLSAPQTQWTSSAPGETVVFDLGSEQDFQMTYYGGICNTSFTVEYSADGQEYSEPFLARYDQGEIFRWLWYKPSARNDEGKFYSLGEYGLTNARYIRITAETAGLVLAEVAFLDGEGEPLPIHAVYASDGGSLADDPLLLIDEQSTVPAHPSYYNGTYFDEIYFARTAYEHLHGLHTYEWTHPPLGKLLIALGIRLFGMTPFGWRFAGALSGVLMLPVMYLLVRQLTKRRFPAIFGMLLLALDCMHFTQSRLATIDCFAVLFIMCMYLCMFRYVQMSFYHQPLWRTLVPLALCGLSFALGCATKWICIYAGVGLAVLFFATLGRRFAEHRYAKAGMRAFTPEERKTAQRAQRTFVRSAVITCLWCMVFFIAVTLLVYYFSYYWQLTPDGRFNVRAVAELQKTMLNYHAGLGDDTHYFRSPWYEWPLIVRPMWYYSGTEFMPSGWISSISCMGNPAVWWGGLAALFYVLYKALRGGQEQRRRCLWVLIGFGSQFLPWVLVPRSTFIYHYFASVPFLVLSASLLVDDLHARSPKQAVRVGAVWLGAAAVLCGMFYPLMSGTPIPRSYARYLRWFHWYNY